MRILATVALLASMALTGCVSYVKTFDGNGALLGECQAYKGLHGPSFGPGIIDGCIGSPNPPRQK
jgi:hypothetical protein